MQAAAAGVAGGVVGLGILLALPFAFALRRKRKTGAWPAWVPRKRPGSAPSRANYRPAAPNSRAVSSNAALSGSVWAPQIEDSDNMTALRVNLRDSSATENGHSPSSNRKLYTPPVSSKPLQHHACSTMHAVPVSPAVTCTQPAVTRCH